MKRAFIITLAVTIGTLSFAAWSYKCVEFGYNYVVNSSIASGWLYRDGKMYDIKERKEAAE